MPSVDVSTKPPAPPVFLGDGAYAEYDGYHLILYTSDGLRTTNRVALEPDVLHTLVDHIRALNDAYRHQGYSVPFPCLPGRSGTASERTT